MKTVGEVSECSGVSVRTLHHYDELGLLSPSERSEVGYRLYSDADVARLGEILSWRALGFPLDQIASVLDDPRYDRVAALQRQGELVAGEQSRLQTVGEALLDAEARERWGKTDAYRESARRVKRYGEAEWQQIAAQSEAIDEELAALHRSGVPADSAEARTLAERHREHISRWFYECAPEMHRNLGEMYVEDPRFSAHYDSREPGLAAYVRDAIVANSS